MNRKQILSSATIAVFAGILLTWAPTAAYGGGGLPSENPAIIMEGFGCSINALIGGPGFTTDTHSMVNKNNAKMTCHFTGLTPQDPSLISRNFGCNTPGGFTSNTLMVVDENGDGMLRCIIHT